MASSVLSSFGRIETICSRLGRPRERCNKSDFINAARGVNRTLPEKAAIWSARKDVNCDTASARIWSALRTVN